MLGTGHNLYVADTAFRARSFFFDLKGNKERERERKKERKRGKGKGKEREGTKGAVEGERVRNGVRRWQQKRERWRGCSFEGVYNSVGTIFSLCV